MNLIAAVAIFGTIAFAVPTRQSAFHDHENFFAHTVENSAAVPPPPEPEPIVIIELPLPPVTPSDDEGSCTAEINPRRTGCIPKSLFVGKMQSGSFLPDSKHVAAFVNFVGAPADPNPASIYTGNQVIIVKTDNTTFSNGDAWKCITCGIPKDNTVGRSDSWDYPQTFTDGKRLLAGTNIIECGAQLVSDDCTPEKTHVYPIRWNTTPDGSGEGGNIRELRLHPDNVHLVYSSEVLENGIYSEYGYFSKLAFNNSPKTGTPLAPRYDLINVTVLYDPNAKQPVSVEGDQFLINSDAAPMVGELRGFTGTGNEITYVGYPAESSNIDLFAADLTTGKVRRLTSHPEYADPIDVSPVDDWVVVMDTRGSNRQMFMAGMRGIPPITDIITTSATSSTRNNGQRRFFQPYLIDSYGDRGDYFGQRINAGGDDKPGSISDREWNGMADPRWSPDGTRIVYWQALTVSPACGGENPLPCENSTEPGGRTARLMMAHLTSRKPQPNKTFHPVSDTVPWGTPYEPGVTLPPRSFPGPGNYTLKGKSQGFAQIALAGNNVTVSSVAVTYNNFSDDGINFLEGWENVTVKFPKPTLNHVDWYSDLVRTGGINSTKKTSLDGFHLDIDVLTNNFEANGTLTTTVDGQAYEQPANGT